MKLALIHLLLAGGPPWLIWNLTATDGAEVRPAPVVVVQRVSGGEEQLEATVTTDEQSPGVVVVRAEVAPGSGDGRSETAQVRVVQKGGKEDAQRGWLGVSIEEVPDALADQLDTKGRGVLVSNVVEGSPADKAGFLVHDVIVSVDGEAVEGESLRAVDLIKSRKPGDTAKFGVLRNGEEISLTATLGSRAEAQGTGFSWKFETAPSAEWKEHVQTRGKFIRRGPGGEWTVQDLGDLEKDLAELPQNIRVFVPRGGETSTQVFVEDGTKTIRTQVEQDGSSIEIEQKDDGPITVRRTDEDGKETTSTYEDEDALKAADEEAFAIYSKAGKSIIINLEGHGTLLDGNFHFDSDFDFEFDSEAWKDAMGQWQEQLDSSLEGARETYEKAMKEVHESMAKLKEKGFDGQLQFEHLKREPGDWPMAMGLMHVGKPKYSFEVRTDGTIEARVRKGDSELVQLYKNAADLQPRNPDLYNRYQELQSIKE